MTVEVHLHDMPVPEQFRGRRVLLRAYEEMPVHDFAASLKGALSLSSTPRLLLHNKLVVLDDLQTIAYYYYKYKGKDDVLHIALLFEEGREKEEASTMQAPTKKDEPVVVEAVPVAPVLRKVRGKSTMNTGRGG